MKSFTEIKRTAPLKSIIFLLVFICNIAVGQQNKIYKAIEFNEVICGYSEILVSDTVMDGLNIQILKINTFANFHALGSDINQHQKFTYHINPETGNFIYHDSYFKQGDVETGSIVIVRNDTLRTSSMEGEGNIITPLPDNIILPNIIFYPYLTEDFSTNILDTKTYKIYDVRTGELSEIAYTGIGEEQLDLAGKVFEAVIFTTPDPSTGSDTKFWIDKKSGMRLKMETPSKLSIYLTDASVTKKIKTGNYDDLFFIKTNQSIEDIKAISYMKVKVGMDPVPAVSEADVNIPGQSFIGTIDGNKLDGIFKIAVEKYDGLNAPSFPLDTIQYSKLRQYLIAEEYIESDDPELLAAAKKITAGSEDLWEAACRLSEWVATNIDGSILSGSARETFDKKSGLCGPQSMLMAALCRSVGIPARVVWGCLYTKEYGGSFGHHAWNEVFMGEAGWIALDVTIHETDYVDSGHLRLGVLNTRQTLINYREIEIIDFRAEGTK